MADRARLEQALRAADAAGDVDAARALAQEIRNLPTGRPALDRDQRSIPQRMRDEAIGGNVTGLAYGVAKPFIGAAQLGMRAGEAMFGTEEGRTPLSQQVAGGLQNFEQAREEAGGSSVPVMAGQTLTGAAALGGIAPAAGFIGRAAQGVGIGGAMGAVEPVTTGGANFDAQKGAQVAGGAVAGGALSLIGSLATTLARRILPKGAEIEAGRVANELAGDRQSQIVQALGPTPARPNTAWPQDSRFVPAAQRGAPPQPPVGGLTAGQAAAPAQSAEFSALQRRAASVRPSEYQDIAQTQNAARAADLGRIAGTSDDIARAQAARTAATAPLYKAAEGAQAPADVTRTIRLIDRISQRRTNEGAFNVVRDVRQTLLRPFFQGSDELLTPEQRVPQLISASRNISQLLDAKDATGRPVNRAISRELLAIKRSLDGQISKAAPEFGEANRVFADLSKPIDRMKVGQYIQERLIPAINDVGADAPQRATVFANAMRDMNESVRAATGFKRGGGLADLMTPDEMATLNRLGSGLARDVDVQRLAQAGSRRVNEAVGGMFAESAPNALSRPLMIINAVLRRTGSGASERTMNVLAQKMQDPAAMADIMQKATQAERRAIERGIMLYLTSGAVESPDEAVGWSQRMIERGMSQLNTSGATQQ
jgi:hypothetical protein